MDQDVDKDEMQQIRDLLQDILRVQELILHRLDRLEPDSDRAASKERKHP